MSRILNAGEYLQDILDVAQARAHYDGDRRAWILEQQVEHAALNRMGRTDLAPPDLDEAGWARRRGRSLQAGDLWRINKRDRINLGVDGSLPRYGHRHRSEPEAFAHFLTVRREPGWMLDQLGETCAQIGGHLEAVGHMFAGLYLDDDQRGRWPDDLPSRAADVALERAAMWRRLAAVADTVRGTYTDRDVTTALLEGVR